MRDQPSHRPTAGPSPTAQRNRWRYLVVGAAAALALSLATGSTLVAPATALPRLEGPALDTGLYLPADPGTGDYYGGPIYEPGGPDPAAPDTRQDAPSGGSGGPDPASPAPGDGDSDGTVPAPAVDAPSDEATPGEPAAGDVDSDTAAKETVAALELADKVLLGSTSCNGFISGRSSKSAHDLLDELRTARPGDKKGIRDLYTKQVRTADGGRVFAEASYNRLGDVKEIELYKDFHGTIDPAHLLPSDFRSDLRPPPTDAELRAMLILHELGHLTGALEHGEDEAVPEHNRQVMINCVRAALTDRPHPPVATPGPAPAPRQGDDDADRVPSGPYVGPEGGGGGGEVGPPLPDSDRPVLKDCCDEVQPGDGGGGSPYDPDANYDDPFDPFYDDNPNGPGAGDADFIDPDDDPAFDPGYGGGEYIEPGYGGGGGGGSAGCGRGEIDFPFDLLDDVDVFCTA